MISTALILAGTFTTIIPVGIYTLVELAIAVCVGILMLSVIFLSFIIPSFIFVQVWLNRKYGFNSQQKSTAKQEEASNSKVEETYL